MLLVLDVGQTPVSRAAGRISRRFAAQVYLPLGRHVAPRDFHDAAFQSLAIHESILNKIRCHFAPHALVRAPIALAGFNQKAMCPAPLCSRRVNPVAEYEIS